MFSITFLSNHVLENFCFEQVMKSCVCECESGTYTCVCMYVCVRLLTKSTQELLWILFSLAQSYRSVETARCAFDPGKALNSLKLTEDEAAWAQSALCLTIGVPPQIQGCCQSWSDP